MKKCPVRADAIRIGATRYFTGKACRKGHVCERLTINGGCSECHKANIANYYRRNKALIQKKQSDYVKKRPELHAAKSARYREKHPERVKEAKRRNAGIINADTAKRRAMKHKATPLWADLDAIKKIYALAARTGMHVDHRIPLRGRLVCGLHVPENLQLLEPAENLKKNNKFDPDEHREPILNLQFSLITRPRQYSTATRSTASL
jgi:hypothetical protein